MSGLQFASAGWAAAVTLALFSLAHLAGSVFRYSSFSMRSLLIAALTYVTQCLILVRVHGGDGLAQATVIAGCGVAAASDLETGYIFDRPIFAALVIIAIVQVWSGEIAAASFGLLTGCGALFLLYVVTRKRGIGLGDVKLAGVIGAGFGAAGALHALQLAFIAGGAIAAYQLLFKRAGRRDEMKFAPYLGGGAAFVGVGSLLW